MQLTILSNSNPNIYHVNNRQLSGSLLGQLCVDFRCPGIQDGGWMSVVLAGLYGHVLVWPDQNTYIPVTGIVLA